MDLDTILIRELLLLFISIGTITDTVTHLYDHMPRLSQKLSKFHIVTNNDYEF